ncbi:MAG: hypothetical protein JWP87_2506 [Labilithrix sp.]|nr:hypothetical protein [Labilithrix sp.]
MKPFVPSPEERGPDRSVVPEPTLGADILRSSEASPSSSVADRAKVIGVLRKAEEFMSTANPPPDSDALVRRALELACGRLGVMWREYRSIVAADPELRELERRVIADARERWGRPPSVIIVTPPGAEQAQDERSPAERLFDRIFVPIDYTTDSHSAALAALDLRRSHGSAMCLFHAAESTGSDDWLAGIGSPAVGGDWIAETNDRLRRFLAHIAPDAAGGVEVRACVGSPVAELSKEARRWGATLVVAAASVQARLLRSPGERILRELQLPVLIIPIA